MSILIKGKEIPTKDELLVLNIYPDGKVTYHLDLECNRIATAVPLPPHGRLIDADALLSQYKGNIWTAQTDYADGFRDVAKDIADAPTIIEAEEDFPSADVKPVVRGKWEVCGMFDDFGRCSNCYCMFPIDTAMTEFHFCPNCGADMRGDAEDV